jgi:hypothetical protein
MVINNGTRQLTLDDKYFNVHQQKDKPALTTNDGSMQLAMNAISLR